MEPDPFCQSEIPAGILPGGRPLVPYARNRTKRLIKTPKLYWNDVGLALHLGGAELSGAHLENYDSCQLSRQGFNEFIELFFSFLFRGDINLGNYP